MWEGDNIPLFDNPDSFSFAVSLMGDKPVFIKEPEMPEGYTLHDGGDCPVHPDTVIRIILEQGDLRENIARNFLWGICPNSIIAYKVIKPETVMVELTVEDATEFAEGGMSYNCQLATRKALDKWRMK